MGIGKRYQALACRHRDHYGEQYEDWRDAGYWTETPFAEAAGETIAAYPDREVIGPHRRFSFAEIDRAADTLAERLRSRGIGPGTVASFQLPNWAVTSVVYLAIARTGAIANPITPIYRRSEVEYILRDADSSCLFVPDEFRAFAYPEMAQTVASDLPGLDDVFSVNQRGTIEPVVDDGNAAPIDRPADNVSPNDPHVLLYTSGTTADPKGVVHTHNTLFAAQVSRIRGYDLDKTTKPFIPSPVTHVAGLLYALKIPFRLGQSVVLMDQWDPELAIERIEAESCTITGGATTFVHDMIEATPDDWDSPLRLVSVGGSYIPPETIREATAALGCRVTRSYGSTELPELSKTPLSAPASRCAETDGKPVPGVEIRLLNLETGAECDPGEQGRIQVYGPNSMLGYLDEAKTDDAFVGPWFDTGDVGILDDAGFLTITGRTKDIIIRGGENIAVKNVEDRLHEHPAVDNVAIVAMPDPQLQERACAYVRVAPGEDFDFETMVEYLESEGITTQKFPERLEFVSSFPQTASGKIEKAALREDIADKLGREPVQR